MSGRRFVKCKWLFWTRNMIEKFIELIKEHECLYNNKNKFYYNRTIKDEICEYILHEMQKDKPAIQIDDIRRKMKVIRTQFARENRLLSMARAQGKTYEPKLWCYDKLLFLEKHTTCVTTPTNKDLSASHDEINTFSEDESFNCDNEDSSLLMDIYKKEEMSDVEGENVQHEEISKSNENIYEGNNEIFKTESDQVNEKNQSEKYDWLGHLVVSQIEDIDLAHRADFIWDIQCLVRKYLLKPKITNQRAQSTSEVNETATTTTIKDITLPKGSSISVNINFL